jgi:hypothetical protein
VVKEALYAGVTASPPVSSFRSAPIV